MIMFCRSHDMLNTRKYNPIFFKGVLASFSALFAGSEPTCTRRFMYAQGRRRKRERERRVGVKRKGRNAPRVSAYRLPVIYFLKFENYTAFNTALAAAPPPCFIHVAINKEQKTVFCKVTHPMPTRGRLYIPPPSYPSSHKSNRAIKLTRSYASIIIANVSLLHKCFSFFHLR